MQIDWSKVNVEIRDADLFKKISPEKLVDYLRKNGWKAKMRIHLGTIWELREGEDCIMCPNIREIADYVTRVSQAVRILAKIEKRSEIAIVESILC